MKNRIKNFVKEYKKELAEGAFVGTVAGLMALAAYHVGSNSVGCVTGGPCGTNEAGQRQFLVCLSNGKDMVFTEPPPE